MLAGSSHGTPYVYSTVPRVASARTPASGPCSAGRLRAVTITDAAQNVKTLACSGLTRTDEIVRCQPTNMSWAHSNLARALGKGSSDRSLDHGRNGSVKAYVQSMS